jgi:hypothetical protein
MSIRGRIPFVALACGLSLAGPLAAGDRTWKFSPADDLYPIYVVDPRRPTMSFELLAVDREIPATGDTRFCLRAGGRFPVARLHRSDTPDRGLDVAIEAGFRSLFDFDRSWDSIGWDGLYGLHVGWAPRRTRAVFRFAIAHDSSHIGDEYAEATGRTRIDYTREEWIAGVSLPLGERFRTYAETGWAMSLEAYQEAGRAQAGLEWQGPSAPWGRDSRWYAGVDANAFDESDWRVDVTLQGGIAFPVEDAARTWRVALTAYDGRSLFGEFFTAEERSVSLGVWLDF